jgi:hypothetical protein
MQTKIILRRMVNLRSNWSMSHTKTSIKLILIILWGNFLTLKWDNLKKINKNTQLIIIKLRYKTLNLNNKKDVDSQFNIIVSVFRVTVIVLNVIIIKVVIHIIFWANWSKLFLKLIKNGQFLLKKICDMLKMLFNKKVVKLIKKTNIQLQHISLSTKISIYNNIISNFTMYNLSFSIITNFIYS